MRRFRVISCLASSTQQMNSLRAKGVMSFQAASAVPLATSTFAGLRAACAPRRQALAGYSCGQGNARNWRRAGRRTGCSPHAASRLGALSCVAANRDAPLSAGRCWVHACSGHIGELGLL
jgi:hypothetical protein